MGKGTDPKSGKDIDYFAVRYKQASGAGARVHYKVWQTGGNSEAGTNSSLVREVNYASEKGIEVFGANKYIQITKV
jgi:cytolysin (calcineurin-like family phosphatase)